MGKLILYYFWGSQPCRAVYMLLKYSGIDFTERVIRLDKGEQKRDAYLSIIPTGCVPAIDDDGFVLTESVAILQYLTARYPEQVASHWYPGDMRLRARVDEYMNWQHTSIRKHGDTHFMTKFVYPAFRQIPVDTEKLRLTSGYLNRALDFIEHNFLKHTAYLAGDDVTLADLLGVSEVMQPLAGGYDVITGRPKLASWLERVKARLGPIFDEIHDKLFEITSPR